jgi:RNA polymerase sigma factor (sigma-70 family)
LPDAERELLTLKFFEDLSSAEVAEVLNISVSNVYVRVHRALQRLRAELEKLERVEADHAK